MLVGLISVGGPEFKGGGGSIGKGQKAPGCPGQNPSIKIRFNLSYIKLN